MRKVGPDGLLTTVAGNGVQGYGGNGRALGTNLDGPCAVATDAAGNLYISENATSSGNRYGIKRVTPDGRIARIAGGGTATGTEGITALQASLDWVTSLLVDQVGNLYFIDRTRGVCKVDPGGVLSAVSGGWKPGGLAMDASGALYVLGSSTHIVQKISTPATDQTLGAAGDHLVTDEGLGHVFSPSGLHIATVDLETRAALLTFGYRDGRIRGISHARANPR